jgi:hypothetical protein
VGNEASDAAGDAASAGEGEGEGPAVSEDDRLIAAAWLVVSASAREAAALASVACCVALR